MAQYLFVTNLGNKEKMTGYKYLYKDRLAKKVNGRLPGAWIYVLVKSIKYKIKK